jgi:superfamily II DNA or RNA helicase
LGPPKIAWTAIWAELLVFFENYLSFLTYFLAVNSLIIAVIQSPMYVSTKANLLMFHQKGDDVLLNQANIAIGQNVNSETFKNRRITVVDENNEIRNLVINDGSELLARIDDILSDTLSRDRFIELNPKLYEDYVLLVKNTVRFRRAMADSLEDIINNPQNYLDNLQFEWREVQRECLENCVWALQHGYQRLPFEVPTGGGKSHIFGALVRAFFEAAALREDTASQSLVLTSRTNLVLQLGQKIIQNKKKEDESYLEVDEESEVLNEGTIRSWVCSILSENQIQVPNDDKVRNGTEVRLSIITYQRLTDEYVKSSVGTHPTGLIVCDEAHNVTPRVRGIINKYFPAAIVIGGSATIEGPRRNPFYTFERIMHPNIHLEERSLEEMLVYHENLATLIERGELKPVRIVSSEVGIDLGDRPLNDESIGRILSSNEDLLKDFIRRIWSEDIPLLNAAGSKPLRERTIISFVKSVDLAEKLAEFCRTELDIKASHTFGGDPDFETKKRDLASGELQLLFSCRKLTEGSDIPEVDAILCLWPHRYLSEWLLKQEIGRGLGLNKNNPNADCLVIDGVYQAKEHNLASLLGIFKVYTMIQGGLVAPGKARSLEIKILNLIKGDSEYEPVPLNEIPQHLSEVELELAKKIGWDFNAQQKSTHSELKELQDSNDPFQLRNVQFIERYDVRRVLALKDSDLQKEIALEKLRKAGYTDYYKLAYANINDFKRQDFGNGLKGLAFLRLLPIYEKKFRHIIKKHLIAAAQYFYPTSEEETKAAQLEILQTLGYADYDKLANANTHVFKEKDFGNGMKGFAFLSSLPIFTEKFARITKDHLIAAAQYFYPTSEDETKVAQLEILQRLGYTDYFKLACAKTHEFRKQDFGENRKGTAFLSSLPIFESTFNNINKDHLQAAAQYFYPISEEEIKAALLEILQERGYTDYNKLANANVNYFKEQDFGNGMKGFAFLSSLPIFPEKFKSISRVHLVAAAEYFYGPTEN